MNSYVEILRSKGIASNCIPLTAGLGQRIGIMRAFHQIIDLLAGARPRTSASIVAVNITMAYWTRAVGKACGSGMKRLCLGVLRWADCAWQHLIVRVLRMSCRLILWLDSLVLGPRCADCLIVRGSYASRSGAFSNFESRASYSMRFNLLKRVGSRVFVYLRRT